ncbi:MAG: FimV/HubP family polar landmark protein [bacterium]
MALLATSLAVPAQTWALGLDELDVTSALNERFAGTIELLDAQGLQPSEIVVSMASREDFERVGVERFFYLTNLKFNVEIEDGAAIVKVSSTQPIAEPYLNFIVEVLWPRGRLLKEYTVLLDPPTFSQAAAPAVQAPAQVATRPAPEPAQQPARAGTQVDLQARSTDRRPPATRAPADGLMTTRDDTLWQIASRTLPSERVSVNQQMLAIQRKNPQAFMRGNINLLKAGYVLDIPSEAEALGIDTNAATQEVAAQTQAWRSGADTQQIADNTPAATSDEQPQLRSAVDATAAGSQNNAATDQGQGQVRILASSGDLASGTASGDDPTVNVLISEKETLSRQVDELTYQLDREKEIAANEVTVRDRQLEVKNQELAAMAERLRELEAQAAQASQNQNQSPNTTSPDTPWWMSPMVLLGVIVLLILLLVVVLIRLRSARAEQEAFENEFFNEPAHDQQLEETSGSLSEPGEVDQEDVEDAAAASAVEPYIGDVDDIADVDALDLDDQEIVSDTGDTADTADGTAGEAGKTGDAIGEAEIYIAYGRYGQAANLLTSVLKSEPDRWDVRLKLLEVFVESSDESAFSEQAQYILDHCDDEEVLMACRDLEAQFESSVVDLSDDTTTEASPSTTEDEVLELDLDELDSNDSEPAQVEDSAESTLEELEKAQDNTDIEFELEFDDANDSDSAASIDSDKGAGDELGGDLGIDFDPDRAPVDDTLDVDGAAEDDEPALEFENTTADAADDFEFDSPEEGDINSTKLDLAEAYIDMGDADGAQDILKEVLEEGSPEQQEKAQSMLDQING